MGTNIYAIRHLDIPDELYADFKNAATNKDRQALEICINAYDCISGDRKIHIGKSSHGWQFLFNHNEWKYYGHTKESIDKFLRSCDYIVDEYGEFLTVDEFWEIIECHKNGFSGETYEMNALNNPQSKIYSTIKEEYERAKANNWYEAEFDENSNKIDYTKLDYRFADSIHFC